MSSAGKASISTSQEDFTKVTFKPDLAKFKMTHLSKDMVELMTRRAYDIAGSTRGIAVSLNGKRLPVSVRRAKPVCDVCCTTWTLNVKEGKVIPFHQKGFKV